MKIAGIDRVAAILRALSGFVGFVLLLLGLGFFILPDLLAFALFVEPSRAIGINSIRGDFGALFLGMAFFALFGTFSTHRWALLVPAFFLTLIVAGRTIGFLIDGLPIVTAAALVSELVFASVLILSVLAQWLSSPTQSAPDPVRAAFGARSLIALASVAVLIGVALLAQRPIGTFIWTKGAQRPALRDVTATLPDGLHVGFAGTGAPLPSANRAGPSLFVLAGKQLFVVDVGPGSPLNLELMHVPVGAIDAVLLTHLHSDHIGGLGELMLKAWTAGARTRPLQVFGPEGVERVVGGFNQAYALDSRFRHAHHGRTVAAVEGAGGVPVAIRGFDQNQAAVIFQSDDLKVTAFLVDHRPADPALGFRFDYKGRSLVISGDTMPAESVYFHAKGVDLLLHEALAPELLRILQHAAEADGRRVAAKVFADIPSYHTSPEEAARIAADAGARQLVLYHIIPTLPMAFLNAAFLGDSEKFYSGPITVAVDGLLLSLPPNTDEVHKRWILKPQ